MEFFNSKSHKMKKTILLLLFFLACDAYSQNYTTSLPFTMKKDGKSFSYVDKSKDEAYVFLANSKKVKIVRYDNKFNIIDTLMTAISDTKSDMIGFTKNDSSINLIWASKNSGKFIFQNIDFNSKKTAFTTKDLDFSNETILQTFSSNDTFYCLNVVNQSSILKLYCFSNKNELNLKTMDVRKTVFSDSNNNKVSLYDLLAEGFGSFESSFELQNIDAALPNSIAICSKKRKAYLANDELILTFDNNPLSTQLIKINLKDFTHESMKINKPTGFAVTNTNSFLFENNLYQINAASSKLSLSIKKLDGSIRKEFNANLNDEISFKNSDFICEWVNPDTEKKIETTNQFLNKLSGYNIGISCYNYNGKNLVSFGGVSKQIKKSNPDGENSTAYYPTMSGGGAIGGLVAATASILLNGSNSVYNNYGSSRNTISVNSLFSNDFELQSEKVNTYSGNKISHYFNGYSFLKSPTFFSTDKKSYVGYYSGDSKQYVIMEFKN
jgi:hypothetical protein